MWEQLSFAAFLQRYWADNQVSTVQLLRKKPVPSRVRTKYVSEVELALSHEMRDRFFLPLTIRVAMMDRTQSEWSARQTARVGCGCWQKLTLCWLKYVLHIPGQPRSQIVRRAMFSSTRHEHVHRTCISWTQECGGTGATVKHFFLWTAMCHAVHTPGDCRADSMHPINGAASTGSCRRCTSRGA